MAISAVMFFRSDGDLRKIYDAVIEEMGVRDNAPEGAIYHWCAPVDGGMQVCDLWETREQFERFADEKIGPITAKHGLKPPDLQVMPVHEIIKGRTTSHQGTGVFVEFEGEAAKLLHSLDDVNVRMNVIADPPEGLVIHWTMPTASGIRVIDHWRSKQDFDRFVEGRLKPALQTVQTPEPRMTFFEIYNTIDPRVTAKV